MTRSALITGITGQDGSYLAELLLAHGYSVHGLVRHTGANATRHIAPIIDRVTLHVGDLRDGAQIRGLIERIHPTEIYNLAAPSFVHDSWRSPGEALEVIGMGAARILEAIRDINPTIRFCQAGSAEMFGTVESAPQHELSPFRPRTPYGSAKAFAHNLVGNLRDRAGLFACGAILFNHESPRRGADFVTRKVTLAAARIRLGLASELRIGNLDAQRDWGFAGDYVEAMWRMLQHSEPADYVVGTGVLHSVHDLVSTAFDHAGLDWQRYVVVDPTFYRPAESIPLLADASKAHVTLGWTPSCRFESMVHSMVESDLSAVQHEVRSSAA